MRTTPTIWLRTALVAGALNGLLAVSLGAFAAHRMADSAASESLRWIETGTRYGLAHGLALLALAALAARDELRSRWLMLAVAAFTLGTLLFSGTLYVMGLADWHGPAPLVPVGGVLLIFGWGLLLLYGLTARRRGESDGQG